MTLFDTHAHYYDAKFAASPTAEELLNGLMPDPVGHIVNVGTDEATSLAAIEQALRHEGMFSAVGYHPENCQSEPRPREEALFAIEKLLSPETRKKNKTVAIGEIGLDYHESPDYGFYPDKEKQKAYFEAQLSLAEKYALPVIIHDRDAHGDCFEAVLRHPAVTGVFHCYSGSPEMAKELTRRGWYIALGGTLTYKNAVKTRETVLAVPRDKILIETDSPYLSPVPLRGTRNHSGNLVHVVSVLADLLGVTPDEAAELTDRNAKTLFGIETGK